MSGSQRRPGRIFVAEFGKRVTHRLANLDELALLDVELEVSRRLEDHDDGAAELEAAHLVAGVERLALEEG